MMSRRGLLRAGTALMAAGFARPVLAEASGGAEAMIAAAKARAGAPYRPVRVSPAAPFDGLDYDGFRTVRPRLGRAAGLALGAEFRADLLPPGWLFADPVAIGLPGHDTAFRADLFDFDPARVTLPDPLPDPLPDSGGMGFSGLRLLHRLNAPDRWDEVLVLQGASYFRALARDTVYGLSARGLALGTGGAGPEEFPVTREITVFSATDKLQFGCLIDSPRAAAALIATLTPGRETVMACALHLFPREVLPDAGIAPLTSMFQHSALGPARIDDFRPRVHDSEALVIDNGAGERLWRPLANPAVVQMSAFGDSGPRGFGLMQGPVAFDAFRDAEAAYHRRPSAWVRPRGDWGAGAVMLLEIPTQDEFADNIVAFWRPEAPLAPGDGHRFDYDLIWLPPGAGALPDPAPPLPLRPLSSASGVEPHRREGRLFVVDFEGPEAALAGALADLAPVAGATPEGLAVYPLRGAAGQVRVSFVLTPAPETQSAELRLHLRDAAGGPLSPVWLYRWTRRADGQV